MYHMQPLVHLVKLRSRWWLTLFMEGEPVQWANPRELRLSTNDICPWSGRFDGVTAFLKKEKKVLPVCIHLGPTTNASFYGDTFFVFLCVVFVVELCEAARFCRVVQTVGWSRLVFFGRAQPCRSLPTPVNQPRKEKTPKNRHLRKRNLKSKPTSRASNAPRQSCSKKLIE